MEYQRRNWKAKYAWMGIGLVGLGYVAYHYYTTSPAYLANQITDEEMKGILKLARKKFYQENLYTKQLILHFSYKEMAINHKYQGGISMENEGEFITLLTKTGILDRELNVCEVLTKKKFPDYNAISFFLRFNSIVKEIDQKLHSQEPLGENELYKLVVERYKLNLGVVSPLRRIPYIGIHVGEIHEYFSEKKCVVLKIEQLLDDLGKIFQFYKSFFRKSQYCLELNLKKERKELEKLYEFIGKKEFTKKRILEVLGEEVCEDFDYDPLYYVDFQYLKWFKNNTDCKEIRELDSRIIELEKSFYSFSNIFLFEIIEMIKINFTNLESRLKGKISEMRKDLVDFKKELNDKYSFFLRFC